MLISQFIRTCQVFICILSLYTPEACFANTLSEPKTVIITCATGELGGHTAKLLAKEHNLILTGRNVTKLQKLKEELEKGFPHQYEVIRLDYQDKNSIADFKKSLDRKKTSISGIALITPRPQFYGKEVLQEEDTWLQVIQTTFTGPLEALKATLPHLEDKSKIAIIAGTTSVQYLPDAGPTCVIRRMWTTYTKALAHQLGQREISVNTLSPGVVLTNFHKERIQNKAQVNGVSYETQMEQEVSHIPLQRHVEPNEVAQTLKFLLSSDSDSINGINLVLDGGATLAY